MSNYIKAKTDDTQDNNQCMLIGDRDEKSIILVNAADDSQRNTITNMTM